MMTHPEHFGGHIEGAPHQVLEALARRQEGCQSKIHSPEVVLAQHQPALAVAPLQEKVLGLEIAMDDAPFVAVRDHLPKIILDSA